MMWTPDVGVRVPRYEDLHKLVRAYLGQITFEQGVADVRFAGIAALFADCVRYHEEKAAGIDKDDARMRRHLRFAAQARRCGGMMTDAADIDALVAEARRYWDYALGNLNVEFCAWWGKEFLPGIVQEDVGCMRLLLLAAGKHPTDIGVRTRHIRELQYAMNARLRATAC
jgi:hypothetical protein